MKGGELHAIMGPNGSGKTTLSYAIAGHPLYNSRGSVKIDNEELLDLSADERALKGVFLSFQNPPYLEGITVIQLLKKSYFKLNGIPDNSLNEFIKLKKSVKDALHVLKLPEDFLKREVNKNFSGGEKKKMEILQMLVLRPRFVILDEIDSGLDVDSLKIVADAINSFRSNDRVFLVITHYNRILKHLNTTRVHIMKNGSIVRSGDADLALEIEEKGYEL